MPTTETTPDTTFETPGPIAATIESVGGQVRISAGDRSDTVVTVRPTDPSQSADVKAAEQTRVELTNGQLSVKAPRAKLRSLFGRPASVDITVELPSDSRVAANAWGSIRSEGRIGESTFQTAAGSIRLDQTGRLKLRTAAGDVSVVRSAGHVDAATASGTVSIGEIDGSVVVKTSNGAITLGQVSGDARLFAANGDVTVERAEATLAAKTAHGAIRVGEVVRGSVVLESGMGELEVGVREGTSAWLDVRSKYGHVRSELDAAGEPGPTDETVEVKAHTGFGDVLIRRATPTPQPTDT